MQIDLYEFCIYVKIIGIQNLRRENSYGMYGFVPMQNNRYPKPQIFTHIIYIDSGLY